MIFSLLFVETLLGIVANPTRGQLNGQGGGGGTCPRSHRKIWSRETGSAVPFSVSLRISIIFRLTECLLTGSLPSSAAVSIYSVL